MLITRYSEIHVGFLLNHDSTQVAITLTKPSTGETAQILVPPDHLRRLCQEFISGYVPTIADRQWRNYMARTRMPGSNMAGSRKGSYQ
jgi:hypothetical protein